MSIYAILIEPFTSVDVMRYALAACVILSFGCAPLGIFLTQKRMTLAGDALSHSIMPGVAIAFLIFGMSMLEMVIGGIIAGMIVVVLAAFISRSTNLKDDASLGGLYIISLAAGITMISLKGSDEELLHVLFGDIAAANANSLAIGACIVTFSLMVLALIYRPLVATCVDPVFFRSVGGKNWLYNNVFLILVVLNLVASFHLFGTMTAIGILILPGIIANFWSRNIDRLVYIAIFAAVCGGYIGLLASHHNGLPAGPSVVMALGILYLISIIAGKHNSLRSKLFSSAHFVK